MSCWIGWHLDSRMCSILQNKMDYWFKCFFNIIFILPICLTWKKIYDIIEDFDIKLRLDFKSPSLIHEKRN